MKTRTRAARQPLLERWHFVRGLRDGFLVFGKNTTAIVTAVLLSVAYLIGVGLTSLVARIARKHFLELTLHKGTYWKPVTPRKTMEENYRQF